MSQAHPLVGSWYRQADGCLFEVVAVDDDDDTIEVQHYDGTLDEMTLESWRESLLELVGGPDDWSGSVDMDTADSLDFRSSDAPAGPQDPLKFLDQR